MPTPPSPPVQSKQPAGEVNPGWEWPSEWEPDLHLQSQPHDAPASRQQQRQKFAPSTPPAQYNSWESRRHTGSRNGMRDQRQPAAGLRRTLNPKPYGKGQSYGAFPWWTGRSEHGETPREGSGSYEPFTSTPNRQSGRPPWAQRDDKLPALGSGAAPYKRRGASFGAGGTRKGAAEDREFGRRVSWEEKLDQKSEKIVMAQSQQTRSEETLQQNSVGHVLIPLPFLPRQGGIGSTMRPRLLAGNPDARQRLAERAAQGISDERGWEPNNTPRKMRKPKPPRGHPDRKPRHRLNPKRFPTLSVIKWWPRLIDIHDLHQDYMDYEKLLALMYRTLAFSLRMSRAEKEKLRASGLLERLRDKAEALDIRSADASTVERMMMIFRELRWHPGDGTMERLCKRQAELARLSQLAQQRGVEEMAKNAVAMQHYADMTWRARRWTGRTYKK